MKLLLQTLPIRIFHWTMVICVTILLFTGLYLHSPLDMLILPMRIVRQLHTGFGLLLIANLSAQIYYYLFTAKWTEVVFLPRDLVNLRSFFRYTLLITSGHPNYGRYNPGQKLLFTVWFLSVLAASLTSMILLFPNDSQLFQRLLGGLNVIRLFHFAVAVVFASTIPIHIYLVFTQDPAKLQAIFTGYIQTGITPSSLSPEKDRPQAPAGDEPHR